jgi:hypothetical protein
MRCLVVKRRNIGLGDFTIVRSRLGSHEMLPALAIQTGVIDITKTADPVPNDGTGDPIRNSDLINKALRDSSAVCIPPGKYRTGSPIVVQNGQYLFGAGPYSEICYEGDSVAVKDDDTDGSAGPCGYITIRDLSISYFGATPAPTASHGSQPWNPNAIVGLNCGNSKSCLFHRLTISSFSIGVLQGDRLIRHADGQYHSKKDAFNVFSSVSVGGSPSGTWGFHFGSESPRAASHGNLLLGCVVEGHSLGFSFFGSCGNRVNGATAVNCQYGVYLLASLLQGAQHNEIDIYCEACTYVGAAQTQPTHPQDAAIRTKDNLIRYHADGSGGFYTDIPSNVFVTLGTRQ